MRLGVQGLGEQEQRLVEYTEETGRAWANEIASQTCSP
jgi:hypothetical protein